MPTANLFTRDDTFFGICEGLGEDLGINPLFPRLALTLFLFFNPLAALTTYAAIGAIVLLARLLFPVTRPNSSPATLKAAADTTTYHEPERLAA